MEIHVEWRKSNFAHPSGLQVCSVPLTLPHHPPYLVISWWISDKFSRLQVLLQQGVFKLINHSSAQLSGDGTLYKWVSRDAYHHFHPDTDQGCDPRRGERSKECSSSVCHVPCHMLDTWCHHLISSLKEACHVGILIPFPGKERTLSCPKECIHNYGVINWV